MWVTSQTGVLVNLERYFTIRIQETPDTYRVLAIADPDSTVPENQRPYRSVILYETEDQKVAKNYISNLASKVGASSVF